MYAPSLPSPRRSIRRGVHEGRACKLAGLFARHERRARKLNGPLVGGFRFPGEDLGLLEGGPSRTHGPIVSNARLRVHPAIPGRRRPLLCESTRARTSADGRSCWPRDGRSAERLSAECVLDVRGSTPPLPTVRCDTRRAAVGRAAVRRSTVALPQERNFKPDPGSHATAIQRVRAEGSACGPRAVTRERPLQARRAHSEISVSSPQRCFRRSRSTPLAKRLVVLRGA